MARVVNPRSRIFGLDLLRAYAIFCVVWVHGYDLTGHAIPRAVYWLPVSDGVTIFFVLSGFLIGRILLRTFTHSEFDGRVLLNFWIRRWFRTLPAYFTVLIVLVFLWHATGRVLPENLYGYFVFSQNLASPHPVFFGEAWSLAVEEWFYLLVPIPLFLAARSNAIDKKNLVLLLVAACIVVVAAFRAYRAWRFGYPDIGSWDENLRKQVVTRFDSLMFGVLGAYLSLFARRWWRKSAYVALGVGLALLVADKVCSTDYDGKMLYINYAKLTTTSLGALLLLPFLSSLRATGGVFVRMVTLLSLISYSQPHLLLHVSSEL